MSAIGVTDAHSAVPAANAGTLAAGPAAVPDINTASAIAKTRNPPATRSCPVLKYFRASSAVAITRPALSIAHNDACRWGFAVKLPAMPKTPPNVRPMTARMLIGLFMMTMCAPS